MDRGRIELLGQPQIDWCNEYIDELVCGRWMVNDVGEVYTETGDIVFRGVVDAGKIYGMYHFLVDFAQCNDFVCSDVVDLTTLKGIPWNVMGSLDCSGCKSLKKLDFFPEYIGGNLIKICDCDELFDVDILLNVDFDGNVECTGCSKLPIGVSDVLMNNEIFNAWRSTKMKINEFVKEYLGFIEAKKYGI